VYVWADGIYVKAGLEKDKAAMLVLIAPSGTGRKWFLAVESGYRESTEAGRRCSGTSKARGLRAPRLLIADGIWGSGGSAGGLSDGGPNSGAGIIGSSTCSTPAEELQAEARELLTKIPYAETRTEPSDKSGSFKRGPRGRARRRRGVGSTRTGSGS